jgi:hypothetical protein
MPVRKFQIRRRFLNERGDLLPTRNARTAVASNEERAMTTTRRSFGIAAGVLALLACGAAPPRNEPPWLGYRNETRATLVVQGATVVNNVIRRGKPRVVYAGDVCWDQVSPGSKILTIYDARQPNRILYQAAVNVGNADQFFSIQVDAPTKVMVNDRVPPRVRLVPVPPPAPPRGEARRGQTFP